MNKYLIGTGYHDHRKNGGKSFYETLFYIWFKNTRKYSDASIICLATGESQPPELGQRTVLLDGDMGHIKHLSKGSKTHALCGGEAVILTLAMLAYMNESDFVYKEQDCFAFGPWPEQMYAELGDAGMIHGKRLTCDSSFCGLSLMLVRHAFIPTFVAWHLAYQKPNKVWLMEFTQIAMGKRYPEEVRQLSFGYDRDRPFPTTDPVWYIQTKNHGELNALTKEGFL